MPTTPLIMKLSADVTALVNSMLAPVAARDDVDRHLGISHDLAMLRGTAAYGVVMGRILQPGDRIDDLGSVRAMRFASAELRSRYLLHIGGAVVGPGATLVFPAAERARYHNAARLSDVFHISFSTLVDPGHIVVGNPGQRTADFPPLPGRRPAGWYRHFLIQER